MGFGKCGIKKWFIEFDYEEDLPLDLTLHRNYGLVRDLHIFAIIYLGGCLILG